MNFFKNNWIYIVIAFAVVFLIGIGYVTYTRLNQLDTLTPTDQVPSPTPGSDQPADEANITFEITPAETPPAELSCIELVATPLSGEAPLTVSFTGLASDSSEAIIFNFDFGDGEIDSITTPITSDDGTATQVTVHTYLEDGLYNASLSIANEVDVQTSVSCTIDIAVGATDDADPSPTTAIGGTDSAEITPTTAPTNQPTPTTAQLAQGPTTAPTTTITTVTPSPTTAPTNDPTSTTYASPVPTDDVAIPQVPEAGSLYPTLIAGVGAVLLMLLAFAVL